MNESDYTSEGKNEDACSIRFGAILVAFLFAALGVGIEIALSPVMGNISDFLYTLGIRRRVVRDIAGVFVFFLFPLIIPALVYATAAWVYRLRGYTEGIMAVHFKIFWRAVWWTLGVLALCGILFFGTCVMMLSGF